MTAHHDVFVPYCVVLDKGSALGDAAVILAFVCIAYAEVRGTCQHYLKFGAVIFGDSGYLAADAFDNLVHQVLHAVVRVLSFLGLSG